MFVTAQLDGDLSFVFSAWDDGIEPWRFGIYSFGWGRPAGLHTVFGRTLLREFRDPRGQPGVDLLPQAAREQRGAAAAADRDHQR